LTEVINVDNLPGAGQFVSSSIICKWDF
jgi:hypothetical protein